MPRIIPIKDLKKTSELSQMCKESNEPIFITKNGYGDMVIMSMEAFESLRLESEIYSKLLEADREAELTDARYSSIDAFNAIKKSLEDTYAVQA